MSRNARRFSALVALLSGVCSLACSKAENTSSPGEAKSTGTARPAVSAEPSSSSSTSTTTASATTTTASPTTSSSLPALASSTSPPSSKAALTLAEDLNNKALKLHNTKSYREAIPIFEQAVTSAPEVILYRYNLACALARADEKARTLGILREFAKSASESALKKLAFARQDPDFQSLWTDADFQTVTAVKSNKLGPKDVLPLVANALIGKDITATLAYLPISATDKVTLVLVDSLASPENGSPPPKKWELTSSDFSSKIATVWKRAAGSAGFNNMDKSKCDDTCCTRVSEGILHNNIYLDKVCIRLESTGRVVISQIELLDGD